MASRPKSARSSRSNASSKHDRVSKQSFLRANDLKTFERKTIMTPFGFKTVRIYSATDANKNCMNKYRPRPNTAIGIEMLSNTSRTNSSSGRLLNRNSTANELNKLKSKSNQQDQRPSTASSTLSTLSSCQSSSNYRIIYNSRHPSCSPPNLYLHDKLRSDMKSRQRSVSAKPCEECSSVERYNSAKQQKQRSKSADVVERFGSSVHCPKFVKGNPFVTHDELDNGQKQYIWGMAKVYSVDKIKSLRQRHYQSILNHEFAKKAATRGAEAKDRIKIWKEYLDYQKVIDKFGMNGSMKCQQNGSHLGSHSHAKKHKIVGWTMTEFTDNDDDSMSTIDRERASLNEDLIIHDDESAMVVENQSSVSQEKLDLTEKFVVARPTLPKYKIRKSLTSDDDDSDTESQEITVDETLSGEMAEKLSLRDEENFI